jgi:hypothetical protein
MAAEEEHMNRTEVLSRAFQAISWPDAPFEPCMGDLDRLSRSASSSAEVLAMLSLARVHAWLWPQVASASLGSVLALGGMTAETVRDDEDGKILSLSKGDDRWMLAWTGMGAMTRPSVSALPTRRATAASAGSPTARCRRQASGKAA